MPGELEPVGAALWLAKAEHTEENRERGFRREGVVLFYYYYLGECFLREDRKGVDLRGDLGGFGRGEIVIRIYYMKKYSFKKREKEEKRRGWGEGDTVGLQKQDSSYQPTELLNESRCTSQRVPSSNGMDVWMVLTGARDNPTRKQARCVPCLQILQEQARDHSLTGRTEVA